MITEVPEPQHWADDVAQRWRHQCNHRKLAADIRDALISYEAYCRELEPDPEQREEPLPAA
jgi:hypothetical protein